MEKEPKLDGTPIERIVTKEDAIIAINVLRQDIALYGANDSEFSAIRNVLERLERGEVLPEDAVKEVRERYEAKSER